MASNWGLPGFRFLSVRHPVANLNNEELDHRAKDVVNDVVDLLQQGQGSNSGI